MLTSLQAAEAARQAPSQNGFFIVIAVMILVMWLFIWRPESKRRKEMNKFRESLAKGSKIVTAGGIHGTVKEVKENYVLVEVDTNVSIRVDKSMVMADPSAQQQNNNTPAQSK